MFSSLDTVYSKNFVWMVSLSKLIWSFLFGLSGMLLLVSISTKFRFAVSYDLKNAKLPWQCPFNNSGLIVISNKMDQQTDRMTDRNVHEKERHPRMIGQLQTNSNQIRWIQCKSVKSNSLLSNTCLATRMKETMVTRKVTEHINLCQTTHTLYWIIQRLLKMYFRHYKSLWFFVFLLLNYSSIVHKIKEQRWSYP